MTKLYDLLCRIDQLTRDLEGTKAAALREAGWQLSCDIGARWLWERVGDPTVYLAQDEALALVRDETPDEGEDEDPPF